MGDRIAVYGVGNALVDMEYQIDDGFLASHGIPKGHMTLVDEDRLQRLTVALDEYEHRPFSGGSAANTIYAVQGFGHDTGYACRLSNDDVGRYFLTAMSEAGVRLEGRHTETHGHSGRCLVLITPDGERSMNTFLGISSELDRTVLDPDDLRRARYLYIEGYLSSGPGSTDAAVNAREIAEASGVATTLTLSDPSMVAMFKDNLTAILGNGVDHVFCNEEEALDWAGTDRLDVAVNELSDAARRLSITLGARGSLIVNGHERKEVAGFPANVVDTTGAGDIYAGASLFGWLHGLDHEQAARLANFAAADLVSRFGARLDSPSAYRNLFQAFERLT